MLVISRKADESITIGDHIVVTILGIEGDRVKLGIEAPREMTILRQEVFLAVQDQAKIQEMMAEDSSKPMDQLRNLLASEVQDEESGDEKPA